MRKETKTTCSSLTILFLVLSVRFHHPSHPKLDVSLRFLTSITMDHFETYKTTFPIRSRRLRSSAIPGATLHPAIYSTSSTILRDNFISFLSYVKTRDVPILPVTKPDVRSVLGQGASFLVNGAEIRETYTDPVSGTIFPEAR